MRKQAAPPQPSLCAQALPDSQGFSYATATANWHVSGQGRATILLLGTHAGSEDWMPTLAHWTQYFQVLTPHFKADITDDTCLLARALHTDLNARFPKQPLYVLGLHWGCALACELAVQWPQLSGLVLLNAAGHGCTPPSAIPSTDFFSTNRPWTALSVPILTIWPQTPNEPDPTDTAIALSHGNEQHEWMVVPTCSDSATMGQIILRWLQSHD